MKGPLFLFLFVLYTFHLLWKQLTILYLVKSLSFSSKESSGPIHPPQELDFRVLVGFIFSSLNEKGNNCFIIKKNVGSPRMGKLSMKCTPTVVMGKGVYLVNLDRKEWWSGKYLKAPV